MEKEMATHSSVLPGTSHRGAWWATYRPWGCKESDMTEHTHTHTHTHLNIKSIFKFHQLSQKCLLKLLCF